MFDKSKSKKFDITHGQKKKFDIAKQQKKFVDQVANNHHANYETTSINRVIRKIESQDYLNVDPSSERFFAIDSLTGKLLNPQSQTGIRRLFQIRRRNVNYYSVSTKIASVCRINCPVKDIANDRAINIEIKYEVRCEPGNEATLVGSFYREQSPGIGLKSAIIAWVDEFQRRKLEDGVDFILNYFHLQQELQDYICIKALQKNGLNLQVHFVLEHQDELKLYSINSSYFPVRVRDCDDDIDLKFDAQLQVDESNKIKAILHYNQLKGLELLITEQIRQTLLDHFSLNDISYELNLGVRDRIAERLREKLSAVGRILAYLSLDIKAGKLIPEEYSNIEHTVQCKIKESSTPIAVEHRVLLSLCNIGKFRAAKIDRLEDWVKNKLKNFTQTILFEKSYVDLLLEFDPNEIKRPMEEAASAIGYTIKHLTSIPDLEPLKLKDGFKIEDEGTFVTKDTRVKVKLQIIVRGVIRDLRKIENYLYPQAKILEKMKHIVHEVTEDFIHDIDTQHFYTRFYYSDDSNKPSVEKELKNRIARKLESTFCASDINVTPKQLETRIAKRFQELQKGFDSFEFKIFPIREGGYGEPVKYHVDFKVRGVDEDGWYTFQSNDYQSREEEIQHIRRILEEDIKTRLETVPISLIQYTEMQILEKIKEEVDLSREKIVSVFGLVIEVINLRRLPTISELGTQMDLEARRRIAEHTRDTEYEMARMTDKDQLTLLDQLYRKRQEFIETGIPEDDPEFEETNNKIRQIITEKPSYSIKSDKKQIKQLHSQASEKLRLDEPLGDTEEPR